MSMYQRVLVTTDLSSDCDDIVTKAVEIARTIQAQLHILHVVPPDIAEIEHLADNNHYFAQQQMIVEPNYEQQVQCVMQDLGARYDIASDCLHVERGNIKTVVNDFTKRHAIDLVVLGTHNRYGLQLLLASSSDKLIHNVECDILAVRVRS